MVAGCHLAQVNIAKVAAPLDDPLMAEFVGNLVRINALAEASPGFVWRLMDAAGDATHIQAFEDPRIIVNMSVWTSLEALFDFTYRTDHTPFIGRRRDWFEKLVGPHMALWWVKAGHLPDVAEARTKLDLLAAAGPNPDAFTFKQRFPAPAIHAL